jgi:exonuclease VII large subunit
VSRGRIDTRLLEHSNVISACKDEGATSVKDSSQRLSRLRLERSQLRKFVDSQHIALDHLCRKLCESGAPVAALASKVSSLEAHVTKFKSEVAPALATVKQKVKRLQMRLKEKSLQLECLLQKRELETKPVRDQSGLKQALDTVFSRLYACDPDTTCEAETVCSDS